MARDCYNLTDKRMTLFLTSVESSVIGLQASDLKVGRIALQLQAALIANLEIRAKMERSLSGAVERFEAMGTQWLRRYVARYSCYDDAWLKPLDGPGEFAARVGAVRELVLVDHRRMTTMQFARIMNQLLYVETAYLAVQHATRAPASWDNEAFEGLIQLIDEFSLFPPVRQRMRELFQEVMDEVQQELADGGNGGGSGGVVGHEKEGGAEPSSGDDGEAGSSRQATLL